MGKRDVRVKDFNPWILLIFPLFPLAFGALWFFVIFIVARSGWNRLREFATIQKPQGQAFSMQSATIGGQRYRGALSVVVAPNGLYLQPIFIFKCFHAPLLLPWNAFETPQAHRTFWGEIMRFPIQTAGRQSVPITIESAALRAAVMQAIANFRTAPPHPLS